MKNTENPTFNPESKLDEMIRVWEEPRHGGPWREGDLLNFLGARGVHNERFGLSEEEKMQITEAVIKRKPKDALRLRKMIEKWLTGPKIARNYHTKYIKRQLHYKFLFEDERFDDDLDLNKLAQDNGLSF